jgi:ferrous iron transport protein B
MKIALVGNQNSGKTTLFNLLTKNNHTVANYPGTTVDIYVGSKKKSEDVFIDLPGIISLTPYSSEHEITTSYLLNEDVDLIINVVDVTRLEKGLYLTTQLLELDIPMLVAINMIDMLEDQNIKLHFKTLEKMFGVSFFPISTEKNIGVTDLVCAIATKDYLYNPTYNWLNFIKSDLDKIKEQLETEHETYYAIKILQDNDTLNAEIETIKTSLKHEYQEDLYEVIAEKRYNYIETALSMSFKVLSKHERRTEKIDKILLNKYLAIPIFLAVMFVIYTISVGLVGSLCVGFVEEFFGWIQDNLSNWLTSINASDWAVSLLVDGVIGGVAALMPFIPQLILLFFFINILESTGYMTRIAYFLDKLFRRLGLSGKALIPFIIGSGCSVPAIGATRTIEDKKEREMSVILTPFIPCSAKLPIITLFASFFFKQYAGLMTFILYLFSIVIIVISALILKYIFKVKRVSGYISELPVYRVPKMKYVFTNIGLQVWDFIKHALTIITFASVILWFLLSFDFRFNYGIPIETSMLGRIGYYLSYVFYPILGELSWASGVSTIQGLIAKENVVVTMKIIADVSGDSSVFTSSLFSFFTVSSALSFMIFNLYNAPCLAAIGAMKSELKSTKKTIYAVLFQTGFAYLIALIVFNILRLGGL